MLVTCPAVWRTWLAELCLTEHPAECYSPAAEAAATTAPTPEQQVYITTAHPAKSCCSSVELLSMYRAPGLDFSSKPRMRTMAPTT